MAEATAFAKKNTIGEWPALMMVLLGKLRGIDIPDAVQGAVLAAERYWLTQHGRPEDLLRAKEDVWAYVDTLPSRGMASSRGRAARAVLCVLEPDGDWNAASMTADWFADVTCHRNGLSD
ncbi:hypothetical protein AB0N73_02455 [Microbacterium sp. NPDC089189]|uniref:hypothetical protein n=1 Tax=Microbacterium sp. NPDC089189 TaxID=3154972 RepID=UPI00342BE96F